ncbi:MAG TPA: serine hydrolase [Jiangellaceae bacterium]
MTTGSGLARAASRIQECFDEAGVFGSVHAVALHQREREIGVESDEPTVLASVFKLPLLVAFARMVDAGDVDPTAAVTVTPDQRTPGSTGIAAMADAVTMSWRDLARSMIAVSDNAAADALLDMVGLERLRGTLADLGLTATRVAGGTQQLYDSLVEDTGSSSLGEAIARLRDPEAISVVSALDPADPASNVGTCRDLTRLLDAVWRDRAASPEQCAFMRGVLAQQVWTQRLAAGFPFDDVVVAGKTGTFVTLRHEAGVVAYPNGELFAVAVLTRTTRARLVLPAVDAAIARAAKLAVAALR